MSRVGAGTAGAGLLADRGDDESRLRRTVVAGPGGTVEVDDAVLGGVLGSLVDPAVITAGLTVAGHVDRRSRVLTGVVTVAVVLGLCLFRRENYDLVLGRVLAGSPRWAVDGGPPTGQALSTARTRLAPDSMRAVFEQSAAVMPPAGPGSSVFGLLVTAFDGTVFDLAAAGDMHSVFATPSGGRFPQARLVTLVACGTRWILAAALGSSAVSEQHLVDQLAAALRPGTPEPRGPQLLLHGPMGTVHRNRRAPGVAGQERRQRSARPHRAGAARPFSDSPAGRIRRDAHRPPGQDRRPSPAPPARHHRPSRRVHPDRHRRHRAGPDNPVQDPDDPARPRAIPAGQIAAAYAERWQVEVIYLRVKSTLRGAGTRLRGQTPDLAIQEIWGLLTVYNALAGLAVAAAIILDVDPDEISFAAVLALTRTNATTDPGCVHCGHRPGTPVEDLITAIAAQPRNRTRQRTSPRTKTQRRTERTRDVSYTITIETPNLPKD